MSRGTGSSQRQILELLKDQHAPVYQRYLATKTGMTAGNVSRSVKSLWHRGEVEKTENGGVLLTQNVCHYPAAFRQWQKEACEDVYRRKDELGYGAPYLLEHYLKAKPLRLLHADGSEVVLSDK